MSNWLMSSPNNLTELIGILISAFLSFYLVITTKNISKRQNDLDKRKLKLELLSYKKKFFDNIFRVFYFSEGIITSLEQKTFFNNIENGKQIFKHFVSSFVALSASVESKYAGFTNAVSIYQDDDIEKLNLEFTDEIARILNSICDCKYLIPSFNSHTSTVKKAFEIVCFRIQDFVKIDNDESKNKLIEEIIEQLKIINAKKELFEILRLVELDISDLDK